MMEGEVIHIQADAAIIAEIDGLVDLIEIARLTEGSHAHDFVLTFVDFKSEIGGEGGIEQSKRVRETRFAEQVDFIFAAVEAALCVPYGGCCPFAYAIDGEDGSLIKGRSEEGAGGVAHVMLGEEQLIGGELEFV